MSRTDDDSWDITEGVGATALSVARARAVEADSECPLYLDPYAHFFVEAAVEAGWRSPFLDDNPVRAQAMAAYIASRTKFFDDFFTTAGANGLDQAVILAAGLDTRAWRLPWISDTTIYEIDQPKVLEFKERVLAEHQAKPGGGYAAVAVDLRHDWPAALRQAGFDPSIPTAIARPAPDSPGPTSATFSCRTRYSASASSPCTMYISCCRSRARRDRRFATAISIRGHETGSPAIAAHHRLQSDLHATIPGFHI